MMKHRIVQVFVVVVQLMQVVAVEILLLQMITIIVMEPVVE